MNKMRSAKVLFVAAVAAMALSAVGASAASATIVNGKFSSSTFKLTSGTVTIKRNGAEAKSCSLSPAIEGFTEGSTFFGTNEWGLEGSRFPCTGGGSLVFRFLGQAKYDTVAERYYLHVSDLSSTAQMSPWGQYRQETAETDDWTWVNGSGATPSTMTLNEQLVGFTTTGSGKITISGTFTMKTMSGGLITLSH